MPDTTIITHTYTVTPEPNGWRQYCCLCGRRLACDALPGSELRVRCNNPHCSAHGWTITIRTAGQSPQPGKPCG